MTHAAPTSRRLLAVASLVLMAMLWGSTFFSIKALVVHLPVADMLGVRFTISALVLSVLCWRHFRMDRETLRQGIVLGLLFGASQLLQTFGLARTAASVSGFITGLYVVLTPLVGALLWRTRIPRPVWFGVVLATCGLGLLTLDLGSGLVIGIGELLTLASALGYALHILATDRFVGLGKALSLTLVQTWVLALCCLAAALPHGIQLPGTGAEWGWVLYLAVLCGALTMFLQMWAQSEVEPTTAAVIMAAEPVWAAVFAVLFGGELLKWQMVVGGCAMFTAMVLVTVAPRLEAAVVRRASAGSSELRSTTSAAQTEQAPG